MIAVVLEDWQVALFGLLGFIVVVLIIFKLWRDPTLRKIKVGVFVERERFKDYEPREWPKPDDDADPTLHKWPDDETKEKP